MKRIILLLTMGIPLMLSAQDFGQFVISPIGTFGESPQLYLSWTVGQIEFETGRSPAFYITQGFEQPDTFVADSSIIIGLNEIGGQGDNLSIYPNPTSNELNIKVDPLMIGSPFFIIDCFGKTVVAGKLEKQTSILNLGNLAEGMYGLRIGETSNRTYRVIVLK